MGLCKRSEIDAVLDSLHDFVGDQNGIREALAAVHHAMSDRVNVGHALDFRNAGIRRGRPANDEIERPGNVFQGCGELLFGAVALLHGDDRFGADSLDFAAQQANVLILADPLKIGGDDLKLQAGAAGVENENVHGIFFREFSSTGFSLWGLVLARTNTHRLKPVLLKANTATSSS